MIKKAYICNMNPEEIIQERGYFTDEEKLELFIDPKEELLNLIINSIDWHFIKISVNIIIEYNLDSSKEPLKSFLSNKKINGFLNIEYKTYDKPEGSPPFLNNYISD